MFESNPNLHFYSTTTNKNDRAIGSNAFCVSFSPIRLYRLQCSMSTQKKNKKKEKISTAGMSSTVGDKQPAESTTLIIRFIRALRENVLIRNYRLHDSGTNSVDVCRIRTTGYGQLMCRQTHEMMSFEKTESELNETLESINIRTTTHRIRSVHKNEIYTHLNLRRMNSTSTLNHFNHSHHCKFDSLSIQAYVW